MKRSANVLYLNSDHICMLLFVLALYHCFQDTYSCSSRGQNRIVHVTEGRFLDDKGSMMTKQTNQFLELQLEYKMMVTMS